MKGRFWMKDGQVEVDLLEEKKTGLYYRPGNSDLTMIKEGFKKDYKSVETKDRVVLDLGANVGGFIYKCAFEGAKSVLSYEPEPYNLEVLELNIEKIKNKFPSTLIENKRAAIGAEEGEFNLYVIPGSNSACSASLTVKDRSNRIKIPVKVDSFYEVVEEYKPSIVKMDIEGAEYLILEKDIPSCVKDFAIELHGFSKENKIKMEETYQKFKNSWNIVSEDSKVIFGGLSLRIVHFSR